MRKSLDVGLFAMAIAGLGFAGGALAQTYGALESRMAPNLALPQTAWIKSETLGGSPLEQRLRDTVDLMLRQRGYLPEKFSPYAIRIEIRGLGVASVDAGVAQYTNVQPRLSLWNAASGANAVTVSMILYHQSTGRTYWQAEGTCPSMDAAAVSASMIVPMMENFGLTRKALLGCARTS